MRKIAFYIINILVLSLFIFNTFQITAYSSISRDTSPEISAILNEIEEISSGFNSNLIQAFNYKLANEQSTVLLNSIDTKINSLDKLRATTLKNVQNSTVNNDDRQYYLLLSIIVGYYRLSYEELKDYLTVNNVEQNYKSLYAIYTNIYEGSILTKSLESELNLAS